MSDYWSKVDAALAKEPDLVEKLHPFGEKARAAYFQGTEIIAWNDLTQDTQVSWSIVADAVLDEYDPEWADKKAGF